MRHHRTSFYLGELIPLFLPDGSSRMDEKVRETFLNFLFSCNTKCCRSLLPPYPKSYLEPLILIINCFLIRDKLRIIRPIPDYTRNFLFRVVDSDAESNALVASAATVSTGVAAVAVSGAQPSVTASPGYKPSSPTYSPSSPIYSPVSPTCSPFQNSLPGSSKSSYAPSTSYTLPSSPTSYKPTSPAYRPISPTYIDSRTSSLPKSRSEETPMIISDRRDRNTTRRNSLYRTDATRRTSARKSQKTVRFSKK